MAITLEDVVNARKQWQPSQGEAPTVEGEESTNLKEIMPWFEQQKAVSQKGSPLSSIKPAKVASGETINSDQDSLHKYIISSALQRDLDPVKALALFKQESNFNPATAPSITGQKGIAQFTRGTAKSRNLDYDKLISDPQYGIDSGLDYLKELETRHGNIDKALVAYNGGGDPNYWQNVSRHFPAMEQIYNKHLPSLTSEATQRAASETALSAIQPATEETQLSVDESNEPAIENAVARGLIGAGEAALSLGSAAVSWPLTTALKYGRIAREMVAPIEPGRKGVYQDAISQARQLQEQYIYSPKTEAGQTIGEILTKPIEYINQFAGHVHDWAKEAGFSDDNALLIRDAIETVGLIDLGMLTGKSLGKIKSSTSRLRSQLNKSIESGVPTEELLPVAERLNETISSDPELLAQRSRLLETLKEREAQLQEQASTGSVQEAEGAQTSPSNVEGAAGETGSALGTSVPSQSSQLEAETPAASQSEVWRPTNRNGVPKSDLQLAMEELDPRWRSKYGEPQIEAAQELPTKPVEAVKPKEPITSVVETPDGGVVDTAPAVKSPTPEGVVTDKGVRLGVRPQRGSRTRSFSSEPGEGGPELWKLLTKDRPNEVEPTKYTPQEKVDYIALKTKPIPPELKARMEAAIEGGQDISDKLGKDIRQPVRVEYSQAKKALNAALNEPLYPPGEKLTFEEATDRYNARVGPLRERFERAKAAKDLADQFKESLERERKGIGESNDRSVMDILKDLKTLVWDWDVNPNSLGMNLSEARLSRKQRMALQRLQSDALKYGEDIGDFLEAFHGGQEGMELTPAHIALFRNYLSQIKNPPPPSGVNPSNMRLDAEAMTDDPVVAQRKEYPKGIKFPEELPGQPLLPTIEEALPTNEPLRTFPPIYSSEAQGIRTANEIPSPLLQIRSSRGRINLSLESPYNTLRRANLLDLYYSYRTVNRAASYEVKQISSDIKELTKNVSSESRARIASEAYGRDIEGQVVLDDLGRTEQLTLNANERAASTSIEDSYKALFERVNRTRESIGLDQIPEPENHFLFARTWNVLHDLGQNVNLLSESADKIVDKYQEWEATPFPKTWTQKALGKKYELDPFSQFERYAERVTRQTHFAPFTAKLNELINHKLPHPETGELSWSLQAEKPELHRWLNEWKNYIDGKPSFTTKYDNLLRKLNENEVYSVISGNLGPALAQVTSITKVAYEFGPQYALRALENSLEDIVTRGKSGHRDFAFRISEVLDTIKANRMYGDYADSFTPETLRSVRQALSEGRIRDVTKAIARGGTTPVQFLDIETSVIAFNAAYKYGGEKLGLTGRELVRYADDFVVKTQHTPGVGDVSPIQRSQLGRMMTLFQTYTIREWNWLTQDVLGYGPTPVSNKQAIMNVAKLVAITTAWNILSEDVFHVPSALPTPIRDAHRTQEKGGNPLQIAGSFAFGLARVPVVSGARYGQGVMGPTLTTLTQELPNALMGKQGARPLPETAGKALGVPGLSQTMKLYRAIKRGEEGQVLSPWDRLTGWNEPSTQEGGGSLKGLGSGGLRGRLRGLRR